MLSSIEEECSADLSSASHLNNENSLKTKESLVDFVGGHGPWQFRHWLVFFLASLCASLYIFSTFPLSSHGECLCSTFETSHNAQPCTAPNCISTSTENASKNNISCTSSYEDFLKFDENSDYCSFTGFIIYSKCISVFGIFISGPLIYFWLYNPYLRFSRRTLALIGGLLAFASRLAISWAPNSSAFLFLQFWSIMEVSKVYLLTVMGLMEFVAEDFRLLYSLTGHIGWGLAHLLLPLVAWIGRNWTQYSITLSCVSLLMLAFLCFIPESVEGLLSRGLRARAQKIIRKAAFCNGYPTEEHAQFAQSYRQHDKQEGLKVTFKSCSCQRYFEMMCLFLVGFSASFLYFTTLWLTDWLSGRREEFFALIGTTEVASAVILLFATCFFSAKHIWSAMTTMASISLLIMYAKTNYESSHTLPKGSYLLTTFFSSGAWTIFLLRSLFQPFSSSTSKWKAIISAIAICAGILAATLTDLLKFDNWNSKFLVVYAIPNLTVGISMAVIPETYFKF